MFTHILFFFLSVINLEFASAGVLMTHRRAILSFRISRYGVSFFIFFLHQKETSHGIFIGDFPLEFTVMSRFTYNLSPNCSGKFHSFTRQGISLPLDRQSYSRRLLGLKFEAKTSPLNLAAPGRCQSLYIFLRISRDLCFY